MNRFLTMVSLFISATTTLWAQSNISIVPLPQKMEIQKGEFSLNRNINIQAADQLSSTVPRMIQLLDLQKNDTKATATIAINLYQSIPEEGYELQIDPQKIQINASSTQGVNYALATLFQLSKTQKNERFLPCVSIKDAPRFGYRGMMLDVSRHFFPLNFVKKYIDALSIYKFNTLHLHLTDGAGWRVEIKKYPALTEKAAWREGKTWKEWHALGEPISEMGNPNAIGGFYTQEELKDLVQYAQERGITILPEIELPGHSDEVLEIMPELGCRVDEKDLGGDLCPSNPQTLVFLKAILDEFITIFPSEYIHIGGDEASKRFWKVCPRCQAFMKEKNYNDVDQLQSYLITEIEKYIISKKRKMIGWDEILQGGLAPEATVMSWRGEQGGIDAAKLGHNVIMTPGNYLYFDKYQQQPSTQPEAIGGYLTVEQVYSYNPIPKELSKNEHKYILGAQANLWTEYISTTEHVDYMNFPRALALAEINWSPLEKKNWNDFQNRLQSQYLMMQKMQINYARPGKDVQISPTFNYNQQEVEVSLSSMQHKTPIYYTTDGSIPKKHNGKLYTKPFKVKGSTLIKAAIITKKDSIPSINADSLSIDFHKAIGKKIIYQKPFSKNYPAQNENTLNNGYRGGVSYGDGQWQGYEGNGFEVIIDFEKIEKIQTVQLDFMQQKSVGIYIPSNIEISVSDDLKKFTQSQKSENDISPKKDGLILKTFKFDKPIKGRYLKIKATDDQHGYLFCDEIIVY